MAAKVKSLPSAKKDIRDNRKWYNEQAVALGDDFYTSVKERIGYIEKHPLHYEKKYKNVRSARLTTFPYLVHYIFEEKDDLVVILAVAHTSRDPEVWKTRMP